MEEIPDEKGVVTIEEKEVICTGQSLLDKQSVVTRKKKKFHLDSLLDQQGVVTIEEKKK